MIFLAVGRNPLVGFGACFAGVVGGFSANMLLSPLAAMNAGIIHEASHIVDPSYSVNKSANYYFVAASAVLVTILGTIITDKVVAPRLGEYKGDAQPEKLED